MCGARLTACPACGVRAVRGRERPAPGKGRVARFSCPCCRPGGEGGAYVFISCVVYSVSTSEGLGVLGRVHCI